GGLAIALLFATVHLARAAAKWHEQRGHEQQAAAAEEALRHLQAGYQQAAAPVLADLVRRAPRAATARRFEQDVLAVLPDHADRILADPAWTALTTTLAHAETAGHNPRRLLAEVGTQRELDSAEHPAEVLNWHITAQPNRRTQAARKRSTVSGTSSVSATPNLPATPVADRSQPDSLRRGQ
ncbi:mobilization protein, partial [Streptomyces sp. NPDC088135]